MPVHKHLYESECCSVCPSSKKTSTFSRKDLRKTLSQYVTSDGKDRMIFTNVRKSFYKRLKLIKTMYSQIKITSKGPFSAIRQMIT